MAFQARNLSVAAEIYDRMLSDHDCKIILTLAGSLFSAGLKHVVADMIDHNMVDVIVSTGAIIVDQDFEACSWGKVNLKYQQMVFGEATITLPLLASAAFHRGAWKKRKPGNLSRLFMK